MRARISSAAMVSIALVLWFQASSVRAEENLPKGILKLDGQPAHALKLKNMDGKLTDLGKLRGQWVFVHFWASWCGPCRKEMPTIQAISTNPTLAKMKILLINTAESEDTVFSFLAIVAPDLDTLLDSDGVATDRWQPRGLPATFLVDPKGRMQYLALGGRPWTSGEYGQFLQDLITGKRGSK